jgi:putative Ca2+/H+ antiporter (TMEM165/GDT1 family)
MNKILRFVPTIYYILLAVFWFAQEYESLGTLSYPSIGVFVGLIGQLFTNNKTTGFLYGIIFLIFSGYMVITSATSYVDTKVVTENTASFYTFQLSFFGVSFVMAVLMIFYNRHYTEKRKN